MRALIGGAIAYVDGQCFVVTTKTTPAKLGISRVEALASAGLIDVIDGRCCARAEARPWLKRQIADQNQHAAQHRTLAASADDIQINLSESPLAKLATATNGKPAFLSPHHLLAGERIRGLVERAHLQQRVTMSYDPARVSSGSRNSAGGSVSDMVMDARRALAEISKALPTDCTGAVIDICGYLKGLQQVEAERQWPRRSAKLVLRIGLEQVADYFGFTPVASGSESHRDHNWLDEGARPTEYR